MARAQVLTAYAKPSEKQLLEDLAALTGKSHSEVIIIAIKELHRMMHK